MGKVKKWFTRLLLDDVTVKEIVEDEVKRFVLSIDKEKVREAAKRNVATMLHDILTKAVQGNQN